MTDKRTMHFKLKHDLALLKLIVKHNPYIRNLQKAVYNNIPLEIDWYLTPESHQWWHCDFARLETPSFVYLKYSGEVEMKMMMNLTPTRMTIGMMTRPKVTPNTMKSAGAKVNTAGPMVSCNNKYCSLGSWFHLECIGLAKKDIPEGVWFCWLTCEKDAGIPKTKSETNIAPIQLDRNTGMGSTPTAWILSAVCLQDKDGKASQNVVFSNGLTTKQVLVFQWVSKNEESMTITKISQVLSVFPQKSKTGNCKVSHLTSSATEFQKIR